jgi:hypothetical protein
LHNVRDHGLKIDFPYCEFSGIEEILESEISGQICGIRLLE